MKITGGRVAAILLGLVIGYLVWLAAMATTTFFVSPRHLLVAGVIVVIVIIVGSAALAIRFSRQGRDALSLASWSAPIAPVLASIYSLIVLLN